MSFFCDAKMQANYFMYTLPANGAQINTMPTTSNMNIKHQTSTVNHHSATITNNPSSATHRSSAITQNTVYATTTLQNVQNNHQNAIQNSVFVCQTCFQTFPKASGLKKHMKVHQTSASDNDNSPYKCNACKIDYHNAIAFEGHIKSEHGQPQAFKCVDCGCFRAVELSSVQPFRCEGCSQRKSEPFEATGALNYRVISNTNATASQEVHVNHLKTPKLDMDLLVQSMRSGVEPTNGRRRKLHQCPDCHKCYKHQSTLAMHKKIHTGEYKYKCQFCDKEFYLAEYYNRHMRVHTKEKPYVSFDIIVGSLQLILIDVNHALFRSVMYAIRHSRNRTHLSSTNEFTQVC